MNLIEQLGYYEQAKALKILAAEKYDCGVKFTQKELELSMLEYRRHHNIFEVGGKVYSEDTCVFVPCDINNFLTNRKKQNRSGHTGVSFHKASGKYVAQISFGGKRKHLGLFENPKDGENFYLLVKRRMAIELIEKYKSNLDERVIDALLSKYKPEEIKAGAGYEVLA